MIKEIGILRLLKILLRNPLKLLNLFQVGISYLFFNGSIWGIPPILILEPSTYCQLKCPLCIRESRRFKRGNKHICVSLVEKLLKKCGERLCIVLLYNQGEPLLHPQIIDIIKLFKKYDIIVKISTNGNYKQDLSEDLVLAKTDHVIFDVDGDTQEIYEKYRVGGSLASLLDNMKKLTAAKKRLSSQYPIIEARIIAMRHNIERILQIHALIKPYQPDLITVKKSLIRDEEEFKNSRNFIPDTFNRLNAKVPTSCFYPWIFFCVMVTGDVSPCCYDEAGEFVFGNLLKEELFMILNEKSYRDFRRDVRRDPKSQKLCQSCDITADFYLPCEKFEDTHIHH